MLYSVFGVFTLITYDMAELFLESNYAPYKLFQTINLHRAKCNTYDVDAILM